MGAMRMDITPAPITEPKISPRPPAVPLVLCAMDTMGATEAKVTPIITGSLECQTSAWRPAPGSA